MTHFVKISKSYLLCSIWACRRGRESTVCAVSENRHHLLGESALSLTTHGVMHILHDLDCSLKTVAEGMCPFLANSRFDVVTVRINVVKDVRSPLACNIISS